MSHMQFCHLKVALWQLQWLTALNQEIVQQFTPEKNFVLILQFDFYVYLANWTNLVYKKILEALVAGLCFFRMSSVLA